MRSITFKEESKIDPVTWYADPQYRSSVLHNNKSALKREWEESGRYRYLGSEPETRVITRTIETKVTKDKKIVPGESNIITLGGPFQRVGKQDEAVGGDNQKVG